MDIGLILVHLRYKALLKKFEVHKYVVFHGCQKTTEFNFIFNSKTITDYITTLNFSFCCCSLEIIIIQIVQGIGTLQELSFFGLVDSKYNSVCRNNRSYFMVSVDEKKMDSLFCWLICTMNHPYWQYLNHTQTGTYVLNTIPKIAPKSDKQMYKQEELYTTLSC